MSFVNSNTLYRRKYAKNNGLKKKGGVKAEIKGKRIHVLIQALLVRDS